jgi:Cep192 domain 4
MGNSRRSMTILLPLAVLVIAVVLAVGGTAYAVSGYLNTFNSTYGTSGTRLDTCVLCHPSGTGGARNSFGSDFASGGHNFNAALEALDSDGDGIINGDEIANLTFPGDPNDPASAGTPNIAVSPASVDSGEVVVNGSSSREVTIANTGDAVLNVSSIALDAGTDFTLDLNGGTNACGTANPAIAAAGNCTVAVVFAPTFVGTFGDNLAIASDDPDQPDVSVPLSGTGLDNVTPVVTSATDNGTITLDTSGNAGTSFGDVTALPDTDSSLNQTGKPAGVDFPYGLVSFTVDNVAVGGTITVDVTFPAAVPAGATYYKVGAAGFVEFTDVVFNGNTATLTLTDGGSGDLDGAADGSISDPGGLAVPVSQPSSSGDGGGSCSVIGSGGNGGGGAVLFLTLLAILVALRRKGAGARR